MPSILIVHLLHDVTVVRLSLAFDHVFLASMGIWPLSTVLRALTLWPHKDTLTTTWTSLESSLGHPRIHRPRPPLSEMLGLRQKSCAHSYVSLVKLSTCTPDERLIRYSLNSLTRQARRASYKGSEREVIFLRLDNHRLKPGLLCLTHTTHKTTHFSTHTLY